MRKLIFIFLLFVYCNICAKELVVKTIDFKEYQYEITGQKTLLISHFTTFNRFGHESRLQTYDIKSGLTTENQTFYKYFNADTKEIKPRIREKKVFKDDSLTSIYEYDELGNQVYSKEAFGDYIGEMKKTYDGKLLLKEDYSENNRFSLINHFKYDKLNRVIEKKIYGPKRLDSFILTRYYFNKKREIICYLGEVKQDILTVFNDNNKILKKTNLLSKNRDNLEIYEYSDHGKLKNIKYFNHGKIFTELVYKTNEIKQISFGLSGEVTSYFVKKLNDKNELTEYRLYENDKLSQVIKYKYNEKSMPIQIIEFGNSNNILRKSEYKYDRDGYLLHSKKFELDHNFKLYLKQEQVYKYTFHK